MEYFLWVKALHLIAVICWFAVLFYLPRLFVYHAMTEDQPGKERFIVMERKLYRVIGLPSMLATILFGGLMAYMAWDGYKTQGWFHIKMTLVFFLIGYHHMCGAFMKKFARGDKVPSHKFFRIFNEVPVLFLIVIVFLAVLKQP